MKKWIKQLLWFGEEWECPKCGTYNMAGRWYCGNCGLLPT